MGRCCIVALLMTEVESAIDALGSRADLAQYGPNASALFSLELRFGLDDLRTVADEALTDDKRDRKCDLLYIDRERGAAVIAQAYMADDPAKSEPPSNKAADLNTALSWILDGDVPDAQLGDKLRSAASDLRVALGDGEISVLEIWFIHNLSESINANQELRQVEQTAAALISHHFPQRAEQIEVHALQVSRERLATWYRATATPILVTGEMTVPAKSGHFHESGEGWSAICTSVPASWLHKLHDSYRDELFSANVRGPIPSRRSRGTLTSLSVRPQRIILSASGPTTTVLQRLSTTSRSTGLTVQSESPASLS